MLRSTSLICALLAVFSLALSTVSAEDNPPAGGGAGAGAGGAGGNGGNGGMRGGGQGGQGGRGNFDPEQMKQRMMDRMKDSLGLSDEEMKALQPKIEAVQKLQQEARGGARNFGGGGMRRGRGGNGGGGDAAAAPAPEPKSDSEKKTQELQALLDNKESDVKAVQAKLKEVRDTREKSKADLKKAQDELRELLTPKQEAQLVLMGVLD